MIDRCIDCHKERSTTERILYGYRCRPCEMAWMQRFHEWRAGARDEQMDEVYGDRANPMRRTN